MTMVTTAHPGHLFRGVHGGLSMDASVRTFRIDPSVSFRTNLSGQQIGDFASRVGVGSGRYVVLVHGDAVLLLDAKITDDMFHDADLSYDYPYRTNEVPKPPQDNSGYHFVPGFTAWDGSQCLVRQDGGFLKEWDDTRRPDPPTHDYGESGLSLTPDNILLGEFSLRHRYAQGSFFRGSESTWHPVGALPIALGYADLIAGTGQPMSGEPAVTDQEENARLAFLVPESFPVDQLPESIDETPDLTIQTYRAYARRVEELRSLVEAEEVQVNESSVRDFWSFVRSAPEAAKAGLILTDNGNLRAVWKGDNSSRVGIQFLGDGQSEYLIFVRRPGSKKMSRVVGIDTLEGVVQQIHSFELTYLVNL